MWRFYRVHINLHTNVTDVGKILAHLFLYYANKTFFIFYSDKSLSNSAPDAVYLTVIAQ